LLFELGRHSVGAERTSILSQASERYGQIGAVAFKAETDALLTFYQENEKKEKTDI